MYLYNVIEYFLTVRHTEKDLSYTRNFKLSNIHRIFARILAQFLLVPFLIIELNIRREF